MTKKIRQGTALGYVIEALIPFTEANLKLTFQTNQFVRELSEKTGKAESSLKNALSEAKRRNLLVQHGSTIVLKNEPCSLQNASRS